MLQLLLLFLPLALAGSLNLNVQISESAEISQAVKEFVRVLTEKNPKMIVMAEDHSDFVVKSFYSQVISQIAETSKKKICYFLETAESYQPAINALNIAEPTSFECFEADHAYLTTTFSEIFQRNPRHWLETAELAKLKQKGIQILAVDNVKSRQFLEDLKRTIEDMESKDPAIVIKAAQKSDDMIIRSRNAFMASKTRNLFKSYGCDIGFIAVGKYHALAPARMIGEPLQILEELFPPEFSTITVNARSCDNKYSLDCSPDPRAALEVFLHP